MYRHENVNAFIEREEMSKKVVVPDEDIQVLDQVQLVTGGPRMVVFSMLAEPGQVVKAIVYGWNSPETAILEYKLPVSMLVKV
jgi:hypothetical protein